ncbi:autotransporter domain-containing protein [Pseudomonas sp. ZM23]|uniref:Autotransporter domain-containing protein n=1 Tax=Pseudomonas triclosanedens TaxID=2961893 RepID=A0ABY6ZT46_9PSED|nr:autotransporter outer membrane beta-barrel domain-containing protein [Pseudomonas triclosanedens]MCP8466980.1 autotransporter domain-containing protein [Pseudomonas triclosanedens]MCP8472872.1 autotransporter domain-containing protein [Pseudomonas triclosanedens]MCP8478303.1 autotransporter domain-containing protein [Pseudomonas triclosanedens]WAI47707.1 autotransporter domain-containing protein [Pseudomonas triclosanedens]
MYRKTILALAISGAALPAQAATPLNPATSITLNNPGLHTEYQQYTAPSVELNGSFSGSGSFGSAFESYSDSYAGDLVLNATIDAQGNNAGGVDFGIVQIGSFAGPATEVEGNLINRGRIQVAGEGVSAFLGDALKIGGDLVNEGTLSVKGDTAQDQTRAIEFSEQSKLGGDLVNAASGRILAEGFSAAGISLAGGTINGKLINDGLIQVTGENAVGIAGDEYMSNPIDLGGIVNNGRIVARGDDASAIELYSVRFHGPGRQILNTGVIEADDAGIVIAGFDLDHTDGSGLWIENRGSIIAGDEAIDASQATDGVHLAWNGGDITGNLINLSSIDITGDVRFNGTDATADGANIVLRDAGWVSVGSDYAKTPAHLELGQPHTSLQGNIEVAGNSTLDLNLSSATDPARAVLAVSGTAEFDKGSQIRLAAKGDDFRAEGSRYTLVQAGSVADHGLGVVSRSQLLNVDSYSVDGTQIVANVTAKQGAQVGEVINQLGGSPNAQRASAAFSGVIGRLATSNPNDPVFQAYVGASEDPAALRRLSEQLSPEVNRGATQAATTGQNLISNVTSARTGGLRGASSGDVLKQTGVWVQTLYSEASQDMRDQVAGYNAYSRGLSIGADGKPNEQVTLGVAYSYLRSDVNSKNGNTTDVDTNAFTLYGSFEQDNYFVDASLTYGFNDNESKRRIAGTTAKGDYDSDLLGVNVIGGYTYHINPQFLVEPRLAARYSRVDIDGYHEKGSSAALDVDSQRYEVAELGAGLRVAGSYVLGQGTFEPQAKLMAYHDFAADEARSTSTFVLGDTPFVTSGSSAVRNSYEAGVGADYKLGAVTLGVSYDYVGKTDFDADTFTAKVRYDF